MSLLDVGRREVLILNRLVELIAEDKAIEDTMYHLHRALNSGRIDLDRFIRVSSIDLYSYVPYQCPHIDRPNIGTRTVYETSTDREDQRGITNWREVPCVTHIIPM
jgi:hypothetical protein